MTGAYLVFKQRAFLRLQFVISRHTADLIVREATLLGDLCSRIEILA